MTNLAVAWLVLSNVVRASWWAEPGYYDRIESAAVVEGPWFGTGDYAEPFYAMPVCFTIERRGATRFYRVRRLVVN